MVRDDRWWDGGVQAGGWTRGEGQILGPGVLLAAGGAGIGRVVRADAVVLEFVAACELLPALGARVRLVARVQADVTIAIRFLRKRLRAEHAWAAVVLQHAVVLHVLKAVADQLADGAGLWPRGDVHVQSATPPAVAARAPQGARPAPGIVGPPAFLLGRRRHRTVDEPVARVVHDVVDVDKLKRHVDGFLRTALASVSLRWFRRGRREGGGRGRGGGA